MPNIPQIVEITNAEHSAKHKALQHVQNPSTIPRSSNPLLENYTIYLLLNNRECLRYKLY